jgi:hypothetical protein
MNSFTNVRISLRDWMTSYNWINLVMPYHLYLLFGGIGAIFLNELMWEIFNVSNVLFTTLSTLGYWSFILGIFLTLASPSVKYLPYAFWAYAIYILFPFNYISLSALISVMIYTILGYWTYKYSAVESNHQ